MHFQSSKDDRGKDRNFIDYLMYALAGGAFAAITFSFLLWLEF